jgi:putative heme degradation protein
VDGEPLTLAVYGQRGGGSVERVTWKIEIASLLERLFLGFFSFFS